MTRSVAIGIDIGGSKTLCLLVDRRYRVINEVKFKTAPAKGRKRFTDELCKAVSNLCKASRKKRLNPMAIGIACAGTIDREKVVVRQSYNIPWMHNYPLGALLEKVSGLRCFIGNDVHLGLLAEQRLGAARHKKHVLGVFFGTGVGGAVIIDGRLYHGASGTAGNVGCLFTRADSDPTLARDHGILDRLASKMAIAGAALGLALKQQAPKLYRKTGNNLARVTWGTLAECIEEGEKSIEDLLRSRMQTVGITLSGLTNFLSPEVLVLGGGLTEKMPKLVLEEVETGLRKFLDRETNAVLKIKAAQFENRAGAIGAANLAFERARK